MRGLFFIVGLIGVIALLTLGVSPSWASPAAAMSCHETGSGSEHGGMMINKDAPPPSSAPAKAQMVMGCCIACVSPALPQIPAAVPATHPQSLQPVRLDLPHGRTPSPDHGPPKARL